MTIDTLLAGTVQLDVDTDVGLLLFLREHARTGNAHLFRRGFRGEVGDDVVPEDLRVLHRGDLGEDGTFVVAEAAGAVAFVRMYAWGGNVCASAPTAEAATGLARRVLDRLPPPPADDGRLPVRFVDGDTLDRAVRLAAPLWAEIARLYPESVRGSARS